MVNPLLRNLLSVSFLLGSALLNAHAERVALIIGNASYSSEKPLRNPVNDARLLQGVFKNDLGFDKVIKVENGNIEQLDAAIEQFLKEAHGADAAVFYFSGHGMQDDSKRNYLIPVDARISSSNDLKRKTLSADDIAQKLGDAQPKIALMILDACRDNPFSAGTKSGSKGLARMSDSSINEGMLIAYATRDGQVAQDGGGNNSPYALALADNLKQRNQPILVAFDNVASKVREVTRQAQRPTRYGDLAASVILSPFGKLPATNTKPEPLTASNRPGQTSGLNLDDLEKEEATRKEWSNWQARMKADYDKINQFNGSADLQAKAWDRFLSGWAENNPFSQEDESLRAQGQSKKEQAKRTVQTALQNQQNNQAATTSGSSNPSAGSTFKDCDSCATMVIVPAGNGIARFALGQTEVTQGQWQALMGNNPSYFTNCGADCPVEQVNWDDAQEFIKKLNAKTGKSYRLPTEQEWEHACLAGQKTEYCGGNDVNAVAWYESNSNSTTHAAKGKQANAFGLYDMSGNVWEWTDSCWKGNCGQRVLRGGSWYNDPSYARAAVRDRSNTSIRYFSSGFRVARMLP